MHWLKFVMVQSCALAAAALLKIFNMCYPFECLLCWMVHRRDVLWHIDSILPWGHWVFQLFQQIKHPCLANPTRELIEPFGHRSAFLIEIHQVFFFCGFSCSTDGLPLCLTNSVKHCKHFAERSAAKSSASHLQRFAVSPWYLVHFFFIGVIH